MTVSNRGTLAKEGSSAKSELISGLTLASQRAFLQKTNKHYFDGKCMKCLDVHTKLHFCNPPNSHWSSGGVEVNFPQNCFFPRNWTKVKIWSENSCSPTPTHHGSEVELNWQMYFCTKSCMNIHICIKKSCSFIPTSDGVWVNLHRKGFARIKWNAQICKENWCLATYT